MQVAVITGITGQDGSYLAEHLLGLGYRVIGFTRAIERAKFDLPAHLVDSVTLAQWSPADQGAIKSLIEHFNPSEIYNLAGYTTGSGMFDDPVAMGDINGQTVVRILEAIRAVNPSIRFCQASSREIFGAAQQSPQNENTPMLPRSPYGAAKLYADSMVRIYREHYSLYTVSAILFNHESPRRGLSFITRKITHAAARIKLGLDNHIKLGNLNAVRDWGSASDYVRAMWLMLQQDKPEDFVISTGISHSVRDVCEVAFGYLGLDYRDYVVEASDYFRPMEANPLIGDSLKASSRLGWFPAMSFEDVIVQMVRSDVESLHKYSAMIQD